MWDVGPDSEEVSSQDRYLIINIWLASPPGRWQQPEQIQKDLRRLYKCNLSLEQIRSVIEDCER